MAFKLRSGNGTNFKNMGTSPFKDMKTGSYKQSFESPAKQRKGTEGQDQDKILDDKGNHIGNWVNDKKVMFNDKPAIDPKLDNKYPKSNFPIHSPRYDGPIKKDGFGPSTAFGGVKNPELVKTKKTKSKKVMKDGPKNRVHGAGDTGNWQPHQFRNKKSPTKQLKGSGHGPATKFDKKRYPVGNPELTDKNPFKKDDYYYKINGKAATKAAYLKYENKPGKMEGGGKQTNNPDVYGRKKGGSPSNPK